MTLICAVGIAVFGHKVSDLIVLSQSSCPERIQMTTAEIVSGKLIDDPRCATTPIGLDATAIQGNAGKSRLFGNTEGYTSPAAGNPDSLVSEANP